MAENDASGSLAEKKKTIRPYDIFALAAFFGIVGSFLYIAGTGLGVPDESFYVTIPHRLLQGDSLIVDDWHVSQFSAFMQMLPVKLYVELNGSLDGVILFLRYLFTVFQALTLVVIYPFFRRYKWAGTAAWTVFGMYVPVQVMSLNYYTLCLWPAVIVCTVLCFSDKLKAPVLVILGVLTAVAVLAEPLIAFAFFLYTILVWIKALAAKKKSLFADCGYFVDTRSWAFITLGVFLCAAAFMPFLFRGSDVLSTLKAIPNLFNGVEYDFSLGGNIQTMKVVNRALELYGKFPLVLLCVLTLFALIVRKKNIKAYRPVITLGTAVCLIFAYVHAAKTALTMNHYDYYMLFYGLPLYLCGPVTYLMLEKPDKRWWLLWCSGACLSVLLDISSAVILGVCGAISASASLVFMFALAKEYIRESKAPREPSADGRDKKNTPAAAGAVFAAVCLAAVLVNEAAFDVYRLDFNIIECGHNLDYTNGVCDTALETGAYAGIKTTKTVAAKYNAMHRDMDAFSDESGAPVLVFDRFPYLYLYLDRPYATFSAWYVDWQENDRLLLYYDEHPEKLPEYIYVPLYDPYTYRTDRDMQKKVEWLQSVLDCTAENGEAGCILRANGKKSRTAP